MAPPPANVHVEIEVAAGFQNQTVAKSKVSGVSLLATFQLLFATATSDSSAIVANKIVRTVEMYIDPATRASWGNDAQQKAVISGALLGPIAMGSVSAPTIKLIILT